MATFVNTTTNQILNLLNPKLSLEINFFKKFLEIFEKGKMHKKYANY